MPARSCVGAPRRRISRKPRFLPLGASCFCAARIVVYIILEVLYESFIHPLTILSTLPSAGVGGLLALNVGHMDPAALHDAVVCLHLDRIDMWIKGGRVDYDDAPAGAGKELHGVAAEQVQRIRSVPACRPQRFPS
jgi:hypothetical protein